jgi:hypothetical protein
MSGLSAVRHSLDQIGAGDADEYLVRECLEKVKEVGQTGRIVDLSELQYIFNHIAKKEDSIEIERGTHYEQQSENRVFTLHH